MLNFLPFDSLCYFAAPAVAAVDCSVSYPLVSVGEGRSHGGQNDIISLKM